MNLAFLSNIPPKSLNGIMMWVISFLMLFLLIKKYEKAKNKGKKFWAKGSILENFIILFVFLLTIITFIVYVFILGPREQVGAAQPTHLLLPWTVYSIILSIIAFGFFLFVLFYYFSKNKKYPSIKKFLFSLLILALFFGLQMFTPLFSQYGTLFSSLLSFLLNLFILGILIPDIFASLILYAVFILRKK